MSARPRPLPAGPGQESVWSYPRPPLLDASHRTVEVSVGDVVLGRTARAYRVLETSHPPGWYLPPDDVDLALLERSPSGSSTCEWKGAATYWDVVVGERRIRDAAWSYESPTGRFAAIAGYLSFYPARVTCRVDDEPVTPQEGQFYGGWITGDVVGPFKGAPGTWGW